MTEPTEPALTQPVAGNAQSDPANTVQSQNHNSAPSNVVPANFVEIHLITKPASAEEEMAEEGEDETELSPSEITHAAYLAAVDRGNDFEVSRLYAQYQREYEEEQAEKQRAMEADSADQEYEEDFEDEEPSEPEPDYQYGVNIGGRPGKTAGLSEIKDLIRVEDEIYTSRCVSPQDAVINLFHEKFGLGSEFESLGESLILPTGLQTFGTTRELFDDIRGLLQKHVMLPSKECSLLAYWSIATWFTDYLPFLPSIILSGPASTADMLLRTLAAVCHRPVLLAELSPTILRKLPINEITPTLLVREPQLSRYMSALLNASNQPGYLFLTGDGFQQLYCPKCIYAGEQSKDPVTSNWVQVNLGESASRPLHPLPTEEDIASFQNRLLPYRLLSHDKVAAAKFRVSGFRPEISIVAEMLGAAIVDDVELQRGIIEVLKDRDEQSRVDRASGVNGVVLRAILFHCHQKEPQKSFVREIAATTNRIYADDGESLKVSSQTVGHVLKYLGLYSRRLGNAGRGLMFDKTTQSQAHRLAQGYDVLTVEPGCEYCHEVQPSQSEEVVHNV